MRKVRNSAPKRALQRFRKRVRRTQRDKIAAAVVLARNVLKEPGPVPVSRARRG